MGKGDGSDLKVKIIVKKELVFQCVCAKQENCTVSLFKRTHQVTLLHHNECTMMTMSAVVFEVFPDVGSNAAVISLQNGPVVEGDVKVMFESSAVSAEQTCIKRFFWLHYDSVNIFSPLRLGSAKRLRRRSVLLLVQHFLHSGEQVCCLSVAGDSFSFLLFYKHADFSSLVRLFLPREELDNPHKPKTWGLYKEDFGVTMFFTEP